MEKLEIIQDGYGNKVVCVPEIIFENKQHIDWNKVESYLERYVGETVQIAESKDMICLGKIFPTSLQAQNIPEKQKAQGLKQRQMQYKEFGKCWKLQQIEHFMKTIKRNTVQMLEMVGFIILRDLRSRFMRMK